MELGSQVSENLKKTDMTHKESGTQTRYLAAFAKLFAGHFALFAGFVEKPDGTRYRPHTVENQGIIR